MLQSAFLAHKKGGASFAGDMHSKNRFFDPPHKWRKAREVCNGRAAMAPGEIRDQMSRLIKHCPHGAFKVNQSTQKAPPHAQTLAPHTLTSSVRPAAPAAVPSCAKDPGNTKKHASHRRSAMIISDEEASLQKTETGPQDAPPLPLLQLLSGVDQTT